MHRIDHATAVDALPAVGAAGAAGFFSKGNPSTGTPATVVTADWANAIQEEIAYVIEQNSIPLSKADRTQLYQAIQAMVVAAGGVADATDTTKGIVELATTAEAQAGTDTTRAVTPAGVAAAIAASSGVPNASDTVAGKVELATTAEATAGTDTTRAVTPAGVAAAISAATIAPPADATTTIKGIVELATNSEASTGTDTVRAVTPAGVAAAVAAQVPAASTTVAGRVELATNAECVTGTDTVRAATPAGVSAAIDAKVPDASASVRGIVELATAAEVGTGTDTVRAVTPAGAAATYAKKSGDTFTGAVNAPSFNTTSARRFKADIASLPAAGATAALLQLDVVSYRLLAHPGDEHVGVIAEQLIGTPLEAFVQIDEEGEAKSVDYTSLFAIALASLQHAHSRLDAIERRLVAGGL